MGAYIWVEKHFHLQSFKPFLIFFFHYKALISAFFTSCKKWNILKINNKVPEYQNLTTELKIKTKGWGWGRVGVTIQGYLEGAFNRLLWYIKIKFNSDDNLPLDEILQLYNLIIVVRSVFQENKKHYPESLLDEFLYQL